MNQYQEFIHKSRYARYLDEHKRRETWEETVNRYVSFMSDRFPKFPGHLEEEIIQMNIMPSQPVVDLNAAARSAAPTESHLSNSRPRVPCVC